MESRTSLRSTISMTTFIDASISMRTSMDATIYINTYTSINYQGIQSVPNLELVKSLHSVSLLLSHSHIFYRRYRLAWIGNSVTRKNRQMSIKVAQK